MTAINLKYLQRQLHTIAAASPLVRSPAASSETWDHVVVIPSLGECDRLIECLQSCADAAPPQRVLCIVVVNERITSPEYHKQDNQRLLDHLQLQLDFTQNTPPQTWIRRQWTSTNNHKSGLDVWGVFATQTHALPHDTSLGTIRKIGADLALKLWHAGKIRASWFFSLDADTRVPEDYFFNRLGENNAAAVLPYRHVSSNTDLQICAEKYDHYLKSYRDGLELAGSPYAWYAFSSLLLVSFAAYSKVHGWPNRPAGEDFYLLNKLTKLGPVASFHGKPVQLAARYSDRVGFGTGPALRKIQNTLQRAEPYRIYNPKTFEILREWIEVMKVNAAECSLYAAQVWATRRPPMTEWLESHRHALNRVLQSTANPKLRLKHLHDYFDAFQTLKFVHFVTEKIYPEVALEDCPETTSKT